METDPSLRPVRVLVEQHLALASSTWTIGGPGARAVFLRDDAESVQRGPNSAVTARGGLRVVLPDDAMAIAYEIPAERDPLQWHQTVAFCLPDDAARRAGRTVVTELGPDADALRPVDTAGVLVDLGLGLPAADVCVRTTDPDALAALRAIEGRDPRETDLAAALSHAPHVVVTSAAARLEIFAGTGPRLRLRLDAPPAEPAAPVPDGWTRVLALHPANAATGTDGRPTPFDGARQAAWQGILTEHGDPLLGVVSAQVVDAVRRMRLPESVPLPDDPATRAAVAVALRRLALTDGMSGTLTAWRSRY